MANNRTTTNEPSAPERLASLLLACAFESDPARAHRLAEEYATEFNHACEAAWGRRLGAKRALLDQAELALNAAEATADQAERRRHLQLFELLMASAER
jgi:hypothetical protein